MNRSTRILRAVARRLRRYVLPMVGQPALQEALQRQEEAQRRQEEALQRQQEALEAQAVASADIQGRLVELEPKLGRHLAEEIDRLDSYLVYHVEELRAALAELRGAPRLIPTGPGLAVLVSGESFDYVVPAREEGLLAYLARHGAERIEPGVRKVLATELRPGDVAVDIGANIGLHSVVMAAAVGATGRLLCFEPMPHVAEALVRTLRLNGFGDRSDVRTVGLSDAPGTVTLFAAAHSPMSSLFPLPDGSAALEVEIAVTTLDDVIAPGGRVDVVKMDVEGAEPWVWRGLRRVRADNRRLTVVLEWSASHFARTGASASEFMAEILADGFSLSAIEDRPAGKLVPLSADQATTLEAANLLLVRR